MQQTQLGILLVSFGTSIQHAKLTTIDAIKNRIQNEFPSFAVYEAWTSDFLRKKVKEQEGISIPNLSKALRQMNLDGIRTVIIQPTFVIPGAEYRQMRSDVLALAGDFLSVVIGTPLLTCPKDASTLAAAIANNVNDTFACTDHNMIVFMGHGASHTGYSDLSDSFLMNPELNPNVLYDFVDTELKLLGHSNMFLKLMNSDHAVQEVLEYAREQKPAKIILAPFMLTAGRHALNDMAGDHEDSWASKLKAAGFHVRCIFKGLGEYETIQSIFLDRIRQSIHSLE